MRSQLQKNNLQNELQRLYLSDLEENTEFDLIITIDSDNISFRELGSFLLIVDRFYGRLTSSKFNSYALSEKKHLQISSITSGSTILTINDILKLMGNTNAVMLLLLIQFLGSALKAGGAGLVKIAEAYNKYEKGRLTRYIRKSLKEDVAQNDLLKNLNDKDRKKLTTLLEKKYTAEKKFLVGAAKFARKKLKRVEIKKNEIN